MTGEQQARDLLERMGIEQAQTYSAGDVVELAELIREKEQLQAENAELQNYIKTLYVRIDMPSEIPVQFVGVHPLAWTDRDLPEVGFVQALEDER